MIHFTVAFALLMHVLFWGVGAAVLAMPGRWRRFWPVLVAPAGLALQSAVVWAAAHANLRGTDSYALAAEAIPAALLAAAIWRRGAGALGAELRRWAGVFALVAAGLALLVFPLALAAKGLTTISLGSCDAADYAGGARTLMEFARGERTGFLGLTEVVRVHSADNFFDYWLRINHFTPSALIALNGSVLHCAPHELTSLMTMVILAGSLPVVFWIARAVVGLRGGASLIVAAFYGLSPLTWYAVAQVSPSQLIAAQAIALITWAGFALWRRLRAIGPRAAVECGAVLLLAYWLILGSYNFIVLVCLAPALAHAGGRAWREGAWGRLALWLGAMLAPLVVAGALCFTRVAGLAERLTLLRSYDFGWQIPPLSPEGWLGFVRDASLAPFGAGVRWAVSLALLALIGLGLRGRAQWAWRAFALTGPALAGYVYLQWRGATLGTNASYDAYKLLAVFFPGVLAVSVVWLRGLRGPRRAWMWTALFVVAVAHLQSYSRFFQALKAPPLLVSIELRDLRKIERFEDVRSVNLLLPDMWSRLWANALLLRRPQYFLTHTYEARRNTPLRGEWDLQAGLIAVRPPDGGARVLSPHFSLARTRHPAFVRLSLPPGEAAADGWHAEEQLRGTLDRWRWTSGEARIRVHNPQPHPVTLACTLDARGAEEREVVLAREGAGGPSPAPVRVSPERASLRFGGLEVPPGDSVLVLRSPQPPTQLAGDPRPLGVCVFQLVIEPRQ